MIKRIASSLLTVLFFGLLATAQKLSPNFHAWAPTPPMGWNSWDCFGPTVTESEVKANTDYMASYLKDAGWKYIVVDIRWYVGNDKAHGYNETDPAYSIDSFGRFMPSVNRFPSAENGLGFKPLAAYIHDKGLKFGIHIMRGIPVIAVNKNSLIEGTNIGAAAIYSAKDQGTWLRDMYTIDATKNGAQEYYNSIFKLYASWGLDFVKVDDLTAPYHKEEIEMIRKAIDNCGREILLSTSPGETPIAEAVHIQQHANMWRTVGDFWDSWTQLKEHFTVFERWNKWRIPGGYPDGDMLPLGHIGIRAERGEPRLSTFTKPEQYTLMTLWSIFKSPLMFGGNLPDNDAFTLSLLTNKNVLNVLNNSTNNRQLYNNGNQVVWTADDSKSTDKYLAFFNIEDQQEAMPERAAWHSGNLNKTSVSQLLSADIDITGAKKLFLVVSDAGDGTAWDHADWIAPTIFKGKDSLKLSTLNWTNASAGWQMPRKDTSVSGGTLIVNNITYTNGIGTHANSVIEYDLPNGYTRFKTKAGIDKAGFIQNTGASIKFLIFTQNPAGPEPPDSTQIIIPLNTIGINTTALVTDLWTGKLLGEFKGEFSPNIARHACGFYKISKIIK